MKIMINNRSMQPIYEQIVEQIKTQIVQGELMEGVGKILPVEWIVNLGIVGLCILCTLALLTATSISVILSIHIMEKKQF